MIYNLKNINIKFFLLSFVVFTMIQGSVIQNACGMEDNSEDSLVCKKKFRECASPYRTPKKRRVSSPLTSPRRLPEEGKENFCPNSTYKTPEKKKESSHSTISPPATPEGKLEISENSLHEFLSDDEATIISPEEKMEDESFTIPVLKKRNSTKRIDFKTINPPISSKDLSNNGPSEILPAAVRSIVWPENVTDLQKLTMHIVQKALYRPIVSEGSPKGRYESNPQKVNLDLVTPEKMTAYKALGGNTPPLRENIKSVRGEYSPIRNTKLLPESMPNTLSPVAIEVLRDRKTIEAARKTGAVIPLPRIAHLEPIIEETEEERCVRKETQERDFLETEKRRGKIPEDLKAEMRKEFEIWQDHLNYIQMRKSQLFGEEEIVTDDTADEEDSDIETTETVSEKVKKIRKGEIEDAFFKFVAPHLNHLEVNGYDVYFTKETLDFDRRNREGTTNGENMQMGNCPIGSDKEPMNFHHLTHHDYATHKTKSIIVLITHTLHTAYSGRLHFGRTTYRDLPRKKVIRPLFNLERKTFNQAIAAHLCPEK